MKKQTVLQIVTLIAAAVFLFAAYSHIVGTGSVFKGSSDGEVARAKVIRVISSEKSNVTGDAEYITVTFKAQILSGRMRGKTVDAVQEIDRTYAFSPRAVKQNDKILLEIFSENGGEYYFGDYIRITPLLFLAAVFCLLVIAFSKTKGVKTVISLGITCLAVFTVLLPAILNDRNIYLWTVIICVFITLVTLSLVGGYSRKTLGAFIGCMSGVACSGIIMLITDRFLNMTGLLEEESIYLFQLYPDNPIDMKAILFAMITVGALGAVMDVAMSISSSLWEIKEKSPSIKPPALMKSGFNIGADMMGTMANTLVLAYIGSNLTCVLLMVAYNSNLQQVINKEIIVFELLQALAGSLGMLLALPLTSFVCSLLYSGRKAANTETGR